MFICKECGGVFFVINTEEPPKELHKKDKLVYNLQCDVQCDKCKKIYYSQPYDFGNSLNPVKYFKSTVC